MKGYKQYKTANKWSVRKTGDSSQLVKKVWNVNTGEAGTDYVLAIGVDSCVRRISQIENTIAELTSEKEDCELLKTDLIAL